MDRETRVVPDLSAVAQSTPFPTLGLMMDEAVKQYQTSQALSPQDMRLMNWHFANLEYANAANVRDLSLAGWDQDTGNEFEGEHAQVVGGYAQVPRGIWKCPSLLDVRISSAVAKIAYTSDPSSSSSSAKITCENGEVIEADRVVSTLPLGVLKAQSVQFDPPLPSWKTGPIDRLGYGTLNKVFFLHQAVCLERFSY